MGDWLPIDWLMGHDWLGLGRCSNDQGVQPGVVGCSCDQQKETVVNSKLLVSVGYITLVTAI